MFINVIFTENEIYIKRIAMKFNFKIVKVLIQTHIFFSFFICPNFYITITLFYIFFLSIFYLKSKVEQCKKIHTWPTSLMLGMQTISLGLQVIFIKKSPMIRQMAPALGASSFCRKLHCYKRKGPARPLGLKDQSRACSFLRHIIPSYQNFS